MPYSDEKLDAIFTRTHGNCHICGKTLSWSNYGRFGFRGCWEVEHSVARALGGHPHHLNNLYAACIPCNRLKGCMSTRWARAYHGRTRAPLSAAKKAERRENNSAGLGLLFVGGAMLGGLPAMGAVLFGLVGAAVGYSLEPDSQRGVRRR